MIYRLADKVPKVHSSCFIASSATLIGNVVLKENASVWFNCVIRADNDLIAVGENSNIQDGSILHIDKGYPLTIGANCTVGHKVMLHGCAIGDNTLIGINAVVLNGAKIGENCIIGANALITEGTEIPDNSLVLGSPGKLVKTLDKKNQKLLKKAADHYVENSRYYKSELQQVDN